MISLIKKIISKIQTFFRYLFYIILGLLMLVVAHSYYEEYFMEKPKEVQKTKPKVTQQKTINQAGRDAFAKRWKDPGYTDAGWPQKESFWIFIKSPPKNADMYARIACGIAQDEYKISGFSITVWDFNKKQYGKARCY